MENYIREVHSVKPYTEEWTKDYPEEFVEVEVTLYGSKERIERVWTRSEWREILEKGHWMR